MSDDRTNTNAPPRPEADPPGSRKPYEPPTLIDYGDIATLTQTGGLTMKDFGSKKTRIG